MTVTQANLLAATRPPVGRGETLVTFELTYPRFIHPQVRAHRSIAQNVASNRARPTKQLLEQVRTDPVPFRWRLRARHGMQPSPEKAPLHVIEDATRYEYRLRLAAIQHAASLDALGIAKELVNRLLEPWQWCESVATSTLTGWRAFCALRNHPDAQLEIQELARLVEDQLPDIAADAPVGRVHLPYPMTDEAELATARELLAAVRDTRARLEHVQYAVSAARCARVSYVPFGHRSRSVRKDLDLFFRLATAKPMHASPLEHVACYTGENSGPFPGWSTLRHLPDLKDVIQLVKKI